MSNNKYLRELVASMPKRLAEVIEKDGETCTYTYVTRYEE
jgi:hypothetical protein